MFLPFTPTELQVSNKINQPLKKKQKKKTLLWELHAVERGAGGLHGRERTPTGNESRLKLRPIEETEAKPHSLEYTRGPSAAILLHMCSFLGFPINATQKRKKRKAKPSNPPKLTAKC